MMSTNLSFVFLVIFLVFGKAQGKNTTNAATRMPNLKNFLTDNALVTRQLNCVLEKGPCDRLGSQVKQAIPQVVNNRCARCNRVQAANVKKLITFVQNNYPVAFKELVGKYGPKTLGTGTRTTAITGIGSGPGNPVAVRATESTNNRRGPGTPARVAAGIPASAAIGQGSSIRSRVADTPAATRTGPAPGAATRVPAATQISTGIGQGSRAQIRVAGTPVATGPEPRSGSATRVAATKPVSTGTRSGSAAAPRVDIGIPVTTETFVSAEPGSGLSASKRVAAGTRVGGGNRRAGTGTRRVPTETSEVGGTRRIASPSRVAQGPRADADIAGTRSAARRHTGAGTKAASTKSYTTVAASVPHSAQTSNATSSSGVHAFSRVTINTSKNSEH